MALLNIEEYIEKRVNDQIIWYDEKSKNAQKYYKAYQIVEIILATLIPLLAGYSQSYKQITFIIGLLGTVIAIIESITKLYKFHENWIQYRTTCEMLRYQKYLYLTRSAPYNSKDETVDNVFVRTIENIISAENNQWKLINTDTEEANNKK